MPANYKELIAWQEAFAFVVDLYRRTQRFPREELNGFTSQMRRAAVSVASNIAEGAGRRSRRDFQHFLAIARGSLLEIETQLLIARELGYLGDGDASRLLNQVTEVVRIVSGLRASMQSTCVECEPTKNHALPTTHS